MTGGSSKLGWAFDVVIVAVSMARVVKMWIRRVSIEWGLRMGCGMCVGWYLGLVCWFGVLVWCVSEPTGGADGLFPMIVEAWGNWGGIGWLIMENSGSDARYEGHCSW